jgi:hypothetical protein
VNEEPLNLRVEMHVNVLAYGLTFSAVNKMDLVFGVRIISINSNQTREIPATVQEEQAHLLGS